jgi:hypothetical protein
MTRERARLKTDLLQDGFRPVSTHLPRDLLGTILEKPTHHNAQRDDSLATASPSGLERECTTTPVRTPDTGKEQPLREREKGNEECRKEPISFCWKRGRRKG